VDRKRSFIASLFLAAGILLAAFALYLWLTGRALTLPSRDEVSMAGRSSDPLVGKPAPEFELGSPDGSTLKLSQFIGHPVVVNYWATWCGPCKEEMPLLQRSYEKFSPALVVLGVDAGEDVSDVVRFVDDLGLTFPILLDNDYEVESLLGVMAYPSTVFIDSDGIIQARHIGQLDGPLLDAYLRLIGVGN
jgi:thiol-disulfide isomerase/thioredoxin